VVLFTDNVCGHVSVYVNKLTSKLKLWCNKQLWQQSDRKKKWEKVEKWPHCQYASVI